MAESIVRPPAASGRIRNQKFLGTLYPFDNGNPLYCHWGPTDEEFFRCAIWSHEIAPTTGRHHIQFYGETKKPCSYAQLTQHCGLAPDQVHWEVAINPEQAWDYCSEDKPDGSSRHGCAAKQLGQRPRARAERGGGTANTPTELFPGRLTYRRERSPSAL